jgi:hypothetical protein
MSVYRLRGADHTHRHWVALQEEKRIDENYQMLRIFCDERGLSLSPHWHSVVSDVAFYQVFMFAEEEPAEIFPAAFGGERMHPKEKGKGARWAQWKKVSHKPKARSPYDFS